MDKDCNRLPDSQYPFAVSLTLPVLLSAVVYFSCFIAQQIILKYASIFYVNTYASIKVVTGREEIVPFWIYGFVNQHDVDVDVEVITLTHIPTKH